MHSGLAKDWKSNSLHIYFVNKLNKTYNDKAMEIITTIIIVVIYITVMGFWLVYCYCVCQSMRQAEELRENDAVILSQGHRGRVPAVHYTCPRESQSHLNQAEQSLDVTFNTNSILLTQASGRHII